MVSNQGPMQGGVHARIAAFQQKIDASGAGQATEAGRPSEAHTAEKPQKHGGTSTFSAASNPPTRPGRGVRGTGAQPRVQGTIRDVGEQKSSYEGLGPTMAKRMKFFEEQFERGELAGASRRPPSEPPPPPPLTKAETERLISILHEVGVEAETPEVETEEKGTIDQVFDAIQAAGPSAAQATSKEGQLQKVTGDSKEELRAIRGNIRSVQKRVGADTPEGKKLGEVIKNLDRALDKLKSGDLAHSRYYTLKATKALNDAQGSEKLTEYDQGFLRSKGEEIREIRHNLRAVDPDRKARDPETSKVATEVVAQEALPQPETKEAHKVPSGRDNSVEIQGRIAGAKIALSNAKFAKRDGDVIALGKHLTSAERDLKGIDNPEANALREEIEQLKPKEKEEAMEGAQVKEEKAEARPSGIEGHAKPMADAEADKKAKIKGAVEEWSFGKKISDDPKLNEAGAKILEAASTKGKVTIDSHGQFKVQKSGFLHKKVGQSTAKATMQLLETLREGIARGETHVIVNGKEMSLQDLHNTLMATLAGNEKDVNKNVALLEAIQLTEAALTEKDGCALFSHVQELENRLYSEELKEAKGLVDEIDDLSWRASKVPEGPEKESKVQEYQQKIDELKNQEPEMKAKMDEVSKLKSEIRQIEKNPQSVDLMFEYLEGQELAHEIHTNMTPLAFMVPVESQKAHDLALLFQGQQQELLGRCQRYEILADPTLASGTPKELADYYNELDKFADLTILESRGVKEFEENIIMLLDVCHVLIQNNDFADAMAIFGGLDRHADLINKMHEQGKLHQQTWGNLRDMRHLFSLENNKAVLWRQARQLDGAILPASMIGGVLAGGGENAKLADRISAGAKGTMLLEKAKKAEKRSCENPEMSIEGTLHSVTRRPEFEFTEADMAAATQLGRERFEGNRANYKGGVDQAIRETIGQKKDTKFQNARFAIRREFKESLEDEGLKLD